jgi:hypothetical protein
MIARRIRRLASVVLAAGLALGTVGCASTLSDAATVGFKTNGKTDAAHITRADFAEELGDLSASSKFRKLLAGSNFHVDSDAFDSRASAFWLAELVKQAAIDHEFAARRLKLSDADVTRARQDIVEGKPSPLLQALFPADVFESFSKDFQSKLAERRARADKVLGYYAKPTEAMARQFYDEHKAELACKRVSHILTKSDADAKAVLAELAAGADFAAVAKSKSTDTTTQARGGELGCLQSNQYVAPFQTAADGASLGVPVGPVKTQFGYHVILVTKKAPTFAEVSEQLLQALPSGAAVAEWLTTASIHIDPRFGEPAGVGQDQNGSLVYQVKPPSAPVPRNQRERDVEDGATTTTLPNT